MEAECWYSSGWPHGTTCGRNRKFFTRTHTDAIWIKCNMPDSPLGFGFIESAMATSDWINIFWWWGDIVTAYKLHPQTLYVLCVSSVPESRLHTVYPSDYRSAISLTVLSIKKMPDTDLVKKKKTSLCILWSTPCPLVSSPSFPPSLSLQEQSPSNQTSLAMMQEPQEMVEETVTIEEDPGTPTSHVSVVTSDDGTTRRTETKVLGEVDTLGSRYLCAEWEGTQCSHTRFQL